MNPAAAQAAELKIGSWRRALVRGGDGDPGAAARMGMLISGSRTMKSWR